MLRTLSLLTKVYGQYRNRLLSTFRREIEVDFDELDVDISRVDVDSRHRLRVTLSGRDEEFAANHLKNEFGRCLEVDELEPDSIVRGRLVDVGSVGFGLFVDIGFKESTRLDPLIPLHQLRNQMKADRPLREISRMLCLVEHLPVDVRVSHVDTANQKVEAELGQETMKRLEDWSLDDHERLLVFGANRRMIQDSLRKSSHLDDIYEYDKLGTFETVLVCKRGTRASGIVAAIGPRLRGIPIHLFIPHEIGEWRSAST
jgi:hypothetical protein